MSRPLIATEALGFAYETGRPVLQEVALGIGRGEFVVILGRSGSGKTTLLNLIGGLDRPGAGRIRFGEQFLDAASDRERTLLRRRHVGFVFQFFNLLPALAVGENLALPLQLAGCPPRERPPRVARWLEAVGLPDMAARFPDELSGGEQQRVALARALIHEPDVILADEPTGNLDLETARSVVDLLDTLCRREGRTLVMATHSREVAGVADRVLELRRGRLVDAG